MVGVNAVGVVGKAGETVDVFPDAFVRGVEEVGTVAVNFDSCLLFVFTVCVTADVMTAVEQGYLEAKLGSSLLCNGEAKEARAYDYEISVHLTYSLLGVAQLSWGVWQPCSATTA